MRAHPRSVSLLSVGRNSKTSSLYGRMSTKKPSPFGSWLPGAYTYSWLSDPPSRPFASAIRSSAGTASPAE